MKHWLCASCFSAVLALLPACAAATSPYQLELVPETCVTTEAQPECQIRLRLLVRQGTAGTICLVSAAQPARQCLLHQPAETSSFELAVQTSTSLPLQLTNAAGQPLQQITLQLVRYQSVRKRHQRAYLWNML